MNSLRSRILRGEELCGTIVCLSDPSLCEIMANAGYDYIWIDMEHSYLSCKDVLCHLNTARSVGTATIVRVPQDDLTVTKKVLEMGPDGIIFPMVRSAAQARKLIAATLYPPLGTRGFGPMRAIGYGARDVAEYTSAGSLELCRFIQIEHVDCIEALEEIAAIESIDGFIFGPNDLSGSMHRLGDVFSPEVGEKLQAAIAILRKHGKYIGLAGGHTPDTLRYWSALDIDMITAGSDWTFLYDQSVRTLQDMRACARK